MLAKQEILFNELVKAHHASIYRICRAYLYDVSHADDLYQEILFQVWKSLQNFKGESKVGTWIYRIAVNTAISFNLKNKKQQFESLPDFIQVPYEETLQQKQEQETQLDQLRYCISQLETPDRLVISLVLEDKSYKEIAEITGTNINNVGVKINRIKARLVKLMENRKGI
ncbi:RNA polymerase sigma factor [Pedobacter cryoconitis]|uniref:RNA polymerase sigma-70 factor (ECF subfamily) n=1 Tax=Pedobacter cryoconitis TaxID=188932 RepID=A0A7X0MKG2_9SPHI|nr:RNA polymerase sigma factor [Pedobacter cryoconitis]MBB6502159.1 RNA polymerase sigma-70 factor (ECF subfamily) [Pedobacter cryoconitis]